MEPSDRDIFAIVADVVDAVARSRARIEAAELVLAKARLDVEGHLDRIEQSYRLLRDRADAR